MLASAFIFPLNQQQPTPVTSSGSVTLLGGSVTHRIQIKCILGIEFVNVVHSSAIKTYD